MNLIDTHCHILSTQGYDVKNELEKIKKSTVKKIILIGCSITEACETVEIARLNTGFVYPAIGIHPEETFKPNFDTDSSLNILESMISDNICAIGECGFEYFYLENFLKDNPEITKQKMAEKQMYLFEMQLKLSLKYKLPIIIHCRNGFHDLFEILDKYTLPIYQWKDLPIKSKGIIHSFTDSYENAARVVEMGFKLGINGILTFKNSTTLREVVKKVINNYGRDCIVLETDSPYLSPEPLRGKQNSPVNIEIIDRYLNELIK